MGRLSLAGIIYLVVGIVVAANHHYLTSLHTVRQYGSGLLAILLWPLLLLGITCTSTRRRALIAIRELRRRST